jgi:predicted nucleic acid-binding protein
MARYVIDLACAIKIAEADIQIASEHEILAPTLLRSQVLDHFYRRTLSGELTEADALIMNARFGQLKFRYLGDAVLRRRAWSIAQQLGMLSTYDAEYIALTQLQGEALVAADKRLASVAKKVVSVKSFEALRSPRSP